MNDIVIYTALYGNKDDLKDPPSVNNSCDYICFTDNSKLQSSVWDIVYRSPIHKDPVRNARSYKIQPYKFLNKYNLSLWVDANFMIRNGLELFFEATNYLENSHMLTFGHDRGPRDCIYSEAKAVIESKKDDPDIVEKQMSKYRNEGYPPKRGLSATSILLRKHNEKDMVELANMWWSEICNYSRRDQLSLYYCIWKLGIKYTLWTYPEIDIRCNYWFQWEPHNFEEQEWC